MEDQDFSSCAKTADGKPWNMKITSWNINGIRAWVKVGSLSYKRVIPCVSIALLSTSDTMSLALLQHKGVEW